MTDSSTQQIIRCEGETQFAPLRCFYMCMLNFAPLVQQFLEITEVIQNDPSEVINALYRDNRMWISLALKFIKDYWHGKVFETEDFDPNILENSSMSAHNLSKYLQKNQLIDITMIGILKNRLKMLFSELDESEFQNDSQSYYICS